MRELGWAYERVLISVTTGYRETGDKGYIAISLDVRVGIRNVRWSMGERVSE